LSPHQASIRRLYLWNTGSQGGDEVRNPPHYNGRWPVCAFEHDVGRDL